MQSRIYCRPAYCIARPRFGAKVSQNKSRASFEHEIELKALGSLFEGKRPCLFLSDGIKADLTGRDLNMVVYHFCPTRNPRGTQIGRDTVGPH